MLRKLAVFGVLLAALAPSAYLAWTLRTMPHLGFYHDDSIYWVSARSLAVGDGYRIESLPGEPYQTKYPPLYCALLAGIWKLNPQFPSNLPLATLFAWLMLPLFLWALWWLLSEYGFSLRARAVMLLIAGLSPVTVVFSFSLMPELLFTLRNAPCSRKRPHTGRLLVSRCTRQLPFGTYRLACPRGWPCWPESARGLRISPNRLPRRCC
jgi:hypothetical protein